MRRSLWPPAVLAVLAVTVAGCGNGSSGTANGTASGREQGVKFAECMRQNGVSDFPDPDPSGSYTIDGVVNGSSLNPNSAVFERALGACKKLEPPGFTGAKVTPEQTVARLEFAQCMRDNGVPDFPDPTPDGPLVDTNRIPSASTAAGMSVLNAAMHRCAGLYAGELGLKSQ